MAVCSATDASNQGSCVATRLWFRLEIDFQYAPVEDVTLRVSMPLFHSPVVGEKRKQPADQTSRKRPALESPNWRNAASGNLKEEYWMVQWCVPFRRSRVPHTSL